MLSIGHRTGLFDTLSDAGALTSETLAERAGLQERYVREWLGAMTAARIVRLDPDSERYTLPAEHSVWLTRRSPNNIAVTARWISVLGQVEDDIVRSFREGGGVPYERFRRFHETMAEESDQTTLAGLFDHILPLVPGLRERLEDGIRVADLGCGRGNAILALAERFPNSTFLGLDLGNDAVEWARTRTAELGLDNVTFDVRDLTTFAGTPSPNRSTSSSRSTPCTTRPRRSPCCGASAVTPHERHLPHAGHRRAQPPPRQPRSPTRPFM